MKVKIILSQQYIFILLFSDFLYTFCMSTATYTPTFTIQRNNQFIELTPELDALIERVFEEYREEQAEARLRAEIKADGELRDMLTTMRSQYA